MTEFLLYFEVNIICILILAILWANIKFSEYSPGRRPKVMSKLICTTIAFYILDIIGEYVRLSSLRADPLLVYVLSSLYFFLFAVSAYIWFFYSEILHNKDFFDKKRQQLLLAIPLFALLVLFVVSYFEGWLFSVNSDVGYARGPIFALQATISFSYTLAAGVRSAYFAHKSRRTSSYLDLVTFSLYSFISFACGILQFIIGEFPIMIIGDTVSTLLLYLHYLRNMIDLDPLTQMANRRRLMYRTAETERTLHPGEALYFMFIDVDDFKAINDRYGHIEGDRVLTEISGILKSFCKQNDCFCGRYGGDEFVVVQKLNRAAPFDSPDRIREMFAGKNIAARGMLPVTVSIGYAEFIPGDDIEDLVARADKNMYETKRSKSSPSIFFGGDFHPIHPGRRLKNK